MKHTDPFAPDRSVRTPYTPPRVEVYPIVVEHGFAGSTNSIENPDTVDDNEFWD